jgi:hypothetical protein
LYYHFLTGEDDKEMFFLFLVIELLTLSDQLAKVALIELKFAALVSLII